MPTAGSRFIPALATPPTQLQFDVVGVPRGAAKFGVTVDGSDVAARFAGAAGDDAFVIDTERQRNLQDMTLRLRYQRERATRAAAAAARSGEPKGGTLPAPAGGGVAQEAAGGFFDDAVADHNISPIRRPGRPQLADVPHLGKSCEGTTPISALSPTAASTTDAAGKINAGAPPPMWGVVLSVRRLVALWKLRVLRQCGCFLSDAEIAAVAADLEGIAEAAGPISLGQHASLTVDLSTMQDQRQHDEEERAPPGVRPAPGLAASAFWTGRITATAPTVGVPTSPRAESPSQCDETAAGGSFVVTQRHVAVAHQTIERVFRFAFEEVSLRLIEQEKARGALGGGGPLSTFGVSTPHFGYSENAIDQPASQQNASTLLTDISHADGVAALRAALVASIDNEARLIAESRRLDRRVAALEGDLAAAQRQVRLRDETMSQKMRDYLAELRFLRAQAEDAQLRLAACTAGGGDDAIGANEGQHRSRAAGGGAAANGVFSANEEQSSKRLQSAVSKLREELATTRLRVEELQDAAKATAAANAAEVATLQRQLRAANEAAARATGIDDCIGDDDAADEDGESQWGRSSARSPEPGVLDIFSLPESPRTGLGMGRSASSFRSVGAGAGSARGGGGDPTTARSALSRSFSASHLNPLFGRRLSVSPGVGANTPSAAAAAAALQATVTASARAGVAAAMALRRKQSAEEAADAVELEAWRESARRSKEQSLAAGPSSPAPSSPAASDDGRSSKLPKRAGKGGGGGRQASGSKRKVRVVSHYEDGQDDGGDDANSPNRSRARSINAALLSAAEAKADAAAYRNAAEATVRQLRQQVDELTTEVARIRGQRADDVGRLGAQGVRAATLEGDASALRQEIATLKAEAADRHAEAHRAAFHEAREAFRVQREDIEQRHRHELALAESRLVDMEVRASEAESDLATADEDLRRMEAQATAVERFLNAAAAAAAAARASSRTASEISGSGETSNATSHRSDSDAVMQNGGGGLLPHRLAAAGTRSDKRMTAQKLVTLAALLTRDSFQRSVDAALEAFAADGGGGENAEVSSYAGSPRSIAPLPGFSFQTAGLSASEVIAGADGAPQLQPLPVAVPGSGSIDVDASLSYPQQSGHVVIDAGAGSVDARLPASASAVDAVSLLSVDAPTGVAPQTNITDDVAVDAPRVERFNGVLYRASHDRRLHQAGGVHYVYFNDALGSNGHAGVDGSSIVMSLTASSAGTRAPHSVAPPSALTLRSQEDAAAMPVVRADAADAMRGDTFGVGSGIDAGSAGSGAQRRGAAGKAHVACRVGSGSQRQPHHRAEANRGAGAAVPVSTGLDVAMALAGLTAVPPSSEAASAACLVDHSQMIPAHFGPPSANLVLPSCAYAADEFALRQGDRNSHAAAGPRPVGAARSTTLVLDAPCESRTNRTIQQLHEAAAPPLSVAFPGLHLCSRRVVSAARTVQRLHLAVAALVAACAQERLHRTALVAATARAPSRSTSALGKASSTAVPSATVNTETCPDDLQLSPQRSEQAVRQALLSQFSALRQVAACGRELLNSIGSSAEDILRMRREETALVLSALGRVAVSHPREAAHFARIAAEAAHARQSASSRQALPPKQDASASVVESEAEAVPATAATVEVEQSVWAPPTTTSPETSPPRMSATPTAAGGSATSLMRARRQPVATIWTSAARPVRQQVAAGRAIDRSTRPNSALGARPSSTSGGATFVAGVRVTPLPRKL